MKEEAFFHIEEKIIFSVIFWYGCYYLHIKNIDKKAQKLDETKSLSAQFICTCIFAPMVSLFLAVFHLVKLSSISLYLYAACIFGTCIFDCRYNITCKNRIKIVLSIYEAYNEYQKRENRNRSN